MDIVRRLQHINRNNMAFCTDGERKASVVCGPEIPVAGEYDRTANSGKMRHDFKRICKRYGKEEQDSSQREKCYPAYLKIRWRLSAVIVGL